MNRMKIRMDFRVLHIARAQWLAPRIAGAAALTAFLSLTPQAAGAQAAKPAPAPAATPAPASPAPPAAAADAEAAFATSKAAFDALTEAERRAMQEALIWTGDFQGTATGEFGKRTRDALIGFEKRVGNTTDGTVDAKELAKLLAAAQEARKAVGFALVSDPATGTQIGVPQKLLPARAAEANGQAYASASGTYKLSVFALRGPETDLALLFEKTIASTPDRKVTYKLSKPDFFVVSGEAGTAKFYTRVARASAAGEAVLRGFTLSYPLAAAKDFNAVALAIANSFNPSPGAGSTQVAASPAKDPPLPPIKPSQITPVAPAPGTIVTATVIAAGKAVAILPVGCTAPTANSAPARIAASDAESGLSLLELKAPKAPPAQFSVTALADGAALMVTGYGEAASALTPASLNAAPGEAVVSADTPDQPRIMAPVQPPAAGSAVFDRSGRLAGLIGRSSKAPRRFAGVVPLMTHPVISLPRLLQFSGVAGVLPSAKAGADDDKPRSAGEIVQAVRASLVAVECPK